MTTLDAVVVGAGPAGCIAAIVLARAGARVALLDRAVFPRHKLCGDTLNPGALDVLRRLRLPVADHGLALDGMLVTGPRGARVAARYPDGIHGRAIARRELDAALLLQAAAAGAEIDEGVLVQQALIVDDRHGGRAVGGIVAGTRSGSVVSIRSRLVIAADGRESRLARQARVSWCPPRPRRWAIGGYFTGVSEMGRLGEMHVRPDHYLGVAPLPGGLVNACVVSAERRRLRDGRALLADAIGHEAELRDRFATARLVGGPLTLGPLAVECRLPGMPGLLLAGDAAGFIDPMTGDGLRFALRGGELAAFEALRALERGTADAHLRLAVRRRREFRGKWRFNRALRRLVASPRAVGAASLASRLSSVPLSRIIRFAGDVSAA